MNYIHKLYTSSQRKKNAFRLSNNYSDYINKLTGIKSYSENSFKYRTQCHNRQHTKENPKIITTPKQTKPIRIPKQKKV